MSLHGTIHHVELYVSNLERSSVFWGWLLSELGYNVFQSWSTGISYKLGHTYIVFVQTEEKFLNNGYHRKRTGLNHLAFHVESEEFINRIKQKLIEKGVTILYTEEPLENNVSPASLFFEDPDRIKVELTVD